MYYFSATYTLTESHTQIFLDTMLLFCAIRQSAAMNSRDLLDYGYIRLMNGRSTLGVD